MKKLFILFAFVFLAACGSTSSIQDKEGKSTKIDLSMYDNVVILDFTDATKKHNMPAFAGRNFADRIAASVKEKGVFKVVSREPLADKSIVVSGTITKYEEGNGALRLLIGFGAGSSYFNANVHFTDSLNQQELGKVFVDKQSWALGGIAASTQTVDGYMNEAAKKIAKELADAKNYHCEPNTSAQTETK
ncbi:MAG TPA: DUF4410 domain-containing protein [Chlorobaculum sp.]|jgi:hypothetical protein|uniref:DUF4410 domain-containing protein n=1 Tax=Chlorobaculum tepidum (strain ATCC 49652 / DSM 12025 / NBRC 103806 / TLS) TaxID=194439 RepID=Q8KCX4_CHLTE|nr:DUF4410 domain-containing protein [Chlorobaculum tepidum]AAM72513.1 hypothetical protein CT1283 [Chlorobaculum tepidum TLS]HBU23594.1 DUF4410 domain-containing protein [Chlorobaculum sp.]